MCSVIYFQQMDFLSVDIEYNCEHSSDLAKELSGLQVQWMSKKRFPFHFIFHFFHIALTLKPFIILQMSSGNLPILIYKMTTDGCSESQFQLLGNFLQGKH